MPVILYACTLHIRMYKNVSEKIIREIVVFTLEGASVKMYEPTEPRPVAVDVWMYVETL